MTARHCIRHPDERLLVLSGACPACDLEEWRVGLAELWRARRGLPAKCRVHGRELLTSSGECPECEPRAEAWERDFFEGRPTEPYRPPGFWGLE